MNLNCPICGNAKSYIILESQNNILARYGFVKQEFKYSSLSELDLQVAYCESCEFAWNRKFLYSKIKYDSDQIIEAGHFSKRYTDYQKTAALNLNRVIGFKPKTVVEIGAGAGIFLKELDAIRRIAIEPSDEAKKIDSSIEVFNEYFSQEKFNLSADLVALRQVLEHIDEPIEFLSQILKSFKKSDKFYMYIEVPNSTLTFRGGRFYDYYYEHCNYFSVASIVNISKLLNMRIIDLSTAMDGELISVLLSSENFDPLAIKNRMKSKKTEILKKLESFVGQNKNILAWGASGNGAQILNSLGVTKDIIPFVIDSDINKHGLFLPGTFQKIISPEEAVELKPDVVLVLTQFHKSEIGDACRKFFQNAEVWFLS